MDRANFGIEGESEQFKPKVQNLRTVKVDSVSQQAKKGVTFSEATEHINDTDDALYDDAFSKPPETHILGQQKVNVKNQTKAFENGGIKGGQHGTGTNMEKITGHFSRTALAEDGSVIISIDSPGTQPYVALIGNQSAVLSDNFGYQSQPSYVNSIGRAELLPAPHPHSSGSHPSFKHGYLTTIITVDEHRHDSNSQNTLGEASYYVPPAPPLSTIPTRRNVTDTTQATRPTALQMRPESNHFLLTSKSGSNISNDRTKFNDVDNPSRHMDSSYKHPDLDNDVYENTINQSKPQLLVALPPPPPPLPPSLVNRNHSMSNITQNASAAETKGNPAYLPARPAALLTPEMMQAQYGALSPTNTRMAIDNSANSDFISELKEATKGGALKKMSKNTRLEDKLSPTPITVFSSGQKIDIVNGGVSHETEPKMELKGEWDPKNFIDQVPNRGDLPAWKVQLAAKQIAEKAMKETLEKRKVEEREARFKDMPAWKRAIVERKEAEARSAEEKRQAEEQQRAQHSSNKRVPHVQVMPKSGDKSLAPWQLELQHK
ncbi:hypothetical protein DPMN_168367 [Dreissena polymorpha]|uniref:Uncharacterized protein n=1 Tax=Dreissena polymorpha TaxID=45954 RepID=A0A9D4F6B5_DREPO|nr:hypothetical protein DPMN_168367 [Dreissena polymorpha]